MSRERIAEVLKEKRKARRLSVEGVADILCKKYEIEISSKTLYSYESGHRQPDADLLMALCEIYGITDIMAAFRDPQAETKTPTSEEPEAGAITLEESNALLVSLGYIQPGEDLSDRDLKFLSGVIEILDSWFAERAQRSEDLSGMSGGIK